MYYISRNKKKMLKIHEKQENFIIRYSRSQNSRFFLEVIIKEKIDLSIDSFIEEQVIQLQIQKKSSEESNDSYSCIR